jgi:hypothetical protein
MNTYGCCGTGVLSVFGGAVQSVAPDMEKQKGFAFSVVSNGFDDAGWISLNRMLECRSGDN